MTTPEAPRHPGYAVALVLAVLGIIFTISGAENLSSAAFGGMFTAASMEYVFGQH